MPASMSAVAAAVGVRHVSGSAATAFRTVISRSVKAGRKWMN